MSSNLFSCCVTPCFLIFWAPAPRPPCSLCARFSLPVVAQTGSVCSNCTLEKIRKRRRTSVSGRMACLAARADTWPGEAPDYSKYIHFFADALNLSVLLRQRCGVVPALAGRRDARSGRAISEPRNIAPPPPTVVFKPLAIVYTYNRLMRWRAAQK
jgi:hypothetical protein